MRKLGFVLTSCILLTACGGDDTGDPFPTPTPTSSPTPTPSSSGGLNTGEIKPTADATFISATMEMTTTNGAINAVTGQTSGGTTSDRSTILDTPGFAGSYNTTTGYHLSDAVNAVSFGPAQLTSDTTSSDKNYPTVLFSKISTPIEDYLALYKESATTTSVLGSGTVAPKYSGIAGWQHTVNNSGIRHTRLDYFAFGPATPTSAMPHSGIVKFTILGSGNYARDTDLYFTTVDINTLTVDFAAGTVSATITTSGTNFYTGDVGGLYAFNLAGTIAGNSVTGPTTSGVAVASGEFRLVFIGPNADELILTHVGQDGRGSYVSSSVGVRNPYLQ